MSTFAAGVIASKRAGAAKDESTKTEPPGVSTYIDAIAALVPAEALTAHAVILGFCTTSKKDSDGNSYTAITEATTLKWSFVALLVLCPVLFLAGRKAGQVEAKKLPAFWTTVAQCLIAAAAFVVWTMLQKTTAFDAVDADLRTAPRETIAVLAAIVLGLWAGAIGYKLNKAANT
jgi:hypothetical protein